MFYFSTCFNLNFSKYKSPVELYLHRPSPVLDIVVAIHCTHYYLFGNQHVCTTQFPMCLWTLYSLKIMKNSSFSSCRGGRGRKWNKLKRSTSSSGYKRHKVRRECKVYHIIVPSRERSGLRMKKEVSILQIN